MTFLLPNCSEDAYHTPHTTELEIVSHPRAVAIQVCVRDQQLHDTIALCPYAPAIVLASQERTEAGACDSFLFPPLPILVRVRLVHVWRERLIDNHQMEICGRPARAVHALVMHFELTGKFLLPELAGSVSAMRVLVAKWTPFNSQVSVRVQNHARGFT